MSELSHTNSIFGEPSVDAQFQCDVFMLMPFAENFQHIYEQHIKPVVENRGYTIRRGDDFFSGKSVMHDIWSAIRNAKLIIAECTGRNPNVFYELGMTHTLGKLAIMITQEIEDIPFDIRHLRWIKYQDTAQGREKLEHQLRDALDKLAVQKPANGNQYSKFIGQWRVTTTEVQAGTLIADAGRIIGAEWSITTPDAKGRGFFGPYMSLSPNEYRAIFYLKIQDNTGPDEQLATIDVTSRYAAKRFADRTLTVGDFTSGDEYQAIPLDFPVSAQDESFEFRLRTNPTFRAKKRLTFDRIELWASR